MGVSDDLANDQDLFSELPGRDDTAALRLVESYPSVPLRTLFIELRHADRAVPIGADERDEIISRLVRTRLDQHGLDGGDGQHGSPAG